MDDDNAKPDQLLSEPPDFPAQQHERSGSMSLGPLPTGDDVSPINGDAASSTMGPPPAQIDLQARLVHDVVNSEVSTYIM